MAAPAGKGLSASAADYLKKNAKFAYGGGAVGGLFLASDLKGVLDADNKFTALLKTFKDFVLIRVGVAAAFTAIGGAIKALVIQTGSLDAAFKKLRVIQEYTHQFKIFTGGVDMAKKRVMELSELAKRGPFQFEDILEANKSLEVFTRGAYSSVEATKTIGAAALDSGNNIQDTAKAVGSFYDNLKAGRPVGEAADQLRQMGVISQSTAEELTTMASSGADASVVFAELTTVLEKSKNSTETYKDELASVAAEHEKAKEELKVAFGAPFTANEIQNIQNGTDALKAITPAVGNMANIAGGLYSAFSTATSTLIKFFAQSKIVVAALETLTVALIAASVAAVAFGAGAALPLTVMLAKLELSFLGTSAAGLAFGVAIRALAVASLWGIIIGGVGSLVAATYNLVKADLESEKVIRKQASAHDEATAAIAGQIAAVTTLTDKQEALAKALQGVYDAEKDLTDLRNKQAAQQKGQAPGTPGQRGELRGETYGPDLSTKLYKGEQVLRQRKALVEEAAKLSALDSERVEALIQAEERTRAEQDQLRKGVDVRHQEAKAGLEAGKQLQENRSQTDADIAQKKSALAIARKEFDTVKEKAAAEGLDVPGKLQKQKKKEFADAEKEISDLEKKRLEMGLQMPKASSAFLETQVEQLQHAKKLKESQAELNALVEAKAEPRLIKAKQAEVERERGLAGGVEFTPEAEARAKAKLGIAQEEESRTAQLAEEKRRAKVQTFQIETDIRGQQARRRGDIAGAQAAEDVSSLTKNIEQLQAAGFGKAEAQRLGLAQTQEDIAQQYVPASQIVSSMAAVGGGGEVSQVDPELDSARRREQIQSEMLSVLKILAGQESEQPAQPTFTR
jgi:hypothetical protein